MTYLESAYVYCHMRNDTNEVFYIGKGTGNRAYNSSSRNVYWKNIVKKANGFTVQIIAKYLSHKEAFKFEALLISKLLPKIKLANLNAGGEGGVNPSEETRLKMSLAKLGKTQTKELVLKRTLARAKNPSPKGYKHSKEANEAKSKRMTGVKRDISFGESISKAKLNKNFKHTQETKDKISLTKKLAKENKL